MERPAHPAGHEPTAVISEPHHDLSALEEALRNDADPAAAALEVGASAAALGTPWSELLGAVEEVCRDVTGGEPAYQVVRALSVAWAESLRQYEHGLSCEDPLTGLATLTHLRTRLDEVYRLADKEGRNVDDCHALVIVELPRLEHASGPYGTGRLIGSLALLEVAEAMRMVFDGAETVAGASDRRAIALVDRDSKLLGALTGLRMLLRERVESTEASSTHVWVEGLPRHSQWASHLLDELAR